MKQDIPVYENPVVSTNQTEKGVEYVVNFEVFLGDTFIDELNNNYYASSESKSGVFQVTGIKRTDFPKKLAYMNNILRIR